MRSVALGMVALVGFAGCDDNPTDFDTSDTASIMTNPSVMTVNAGETALLDSRTINAGDEPTWEEISATVDGSCGHSDISVATAATYEPSIQPPGQFDVTAGATLGSSCVNLSGGGVNATVDVTVVGDSLAVTAASDTIPFETTTQMSAVLLSADGTAVSPFDESTDVIWSTDDEEIATVDASGLVTGVGVGTAVITGTWTANGVERSGEVPITVDSPVTPTITSLDVTSGPVGTYVTVTGADFVSITEVWIDGANAGAYQDGSPASTTSLSFWMPNPGAAGVGTYDIQVGITGDLSSALSFTLTSPNAAGEPDSYVTPKVIPGLPFATADYTDPADVENYYEITLAEDTSIDVSADATEGADIDLFVESTDGTTVFCDSQTGTNPEVLEECSLTAGTYIIRFFNWAATIGNEVPSSVRIDVTETPAE